MKEPKDKLPGSWLTIAEVAGIMDVSTDTVTRLIASGSLPAVLIHSGRRKKTFRVRPEAFQAWATSRERSHEQEENKTTMRRPRLMFPGIESSILKPFKNGDHAPSEIGKNLLVST